MTCQICQHENPPDNVFCGACGTRLALACGKCGLSSPTDNVFCGRCGQRLIPENEAAAGPEPETGERRQLTVLFCDLVGSTDLATRLDPEEYREGLRDYYARAEEVVERYGGYVAQHLGDGMLVYFGWPQAFDDSAERAVHAGLGLIASTAAARAGGGPLRARVGLHTGSVVVSDVGVGRYRETLAVGDTPNVAARVQAVAEPGEVVISAATHRLVAGLFVVEERGAHTLKGVPQPVDLYTVMQAAAVRGRLAASASRGLTPFVNRTEERALLRSRFERVCDGEGQVVLLTGEAGIGKSRLAQVLRDELADTPHTWLETAASPHYANTPFHAVAELLRQRRPWDDEDPRARAAQLAESLTLAGLDPAEALPLVAPLLDVPLPPGYQALAVSLETGRKRLLATLTTWLFATARLQPLVILIEDLHWVDPSTLELLQLLLEQVVTVPVLLLGTARPEFQPPWPLRAHYTQLMLSRLTPRHVREMVRGVASQAKLLADVVDEVALRTDGVPLFVEELTKAVTEIGAVAAAREIPTTLTDSLMARLDRLGPQAKEVAQVAAVCGREFSFAMVRAMVPLSEEELDTALRKLVDAELLHARGLAPDATYTFKHALVLDAAYESLLKSRRRLLHGQAAAVLTARFPAVGEERPELLAHHHQAAAALEPAVEAWRVAGERALERGANREGERYLERGLAVLAGMPAGSPRDWSEFQLQLSLGRARIGSQGFGSTPADEAFARAMDIGERLAEPFQLGLILLGRFGLELVRNGPTVARRLSERLLDVTARAGDPSLASAAEFAAGLIDFHLGDPTAAQQHFEKGLASYDDRQPVPFPLDVGLVLRTYLADVHWRLGRVDSARALMDEALERGNRSARASDRAWATQHAALLGVCLREPERVAEMAQRSLDACAEEPSPSTSAMSRVLQGWSLAERGMVDAGRVSVRTGIGELAADDQRLGFELLHCLYADTYIAGGDLDAALRLLEQGATACPDQVGDRVQTLLRRCQILVRQEAAAAEIEAAFAEALQWARRQRAKSHELRLATDCARWLIGHGRADEAGPLLAPLYASFVEGADTRDLREAREVLATLAGNRERDEGESRLATQATGDP